MQRSLTATLLSGLGIAALMILAAVITLRVGSALLGSFEAWQQAFESAQPYLRLWRALLYAALLALWLDLLRRHRESPPARLRVTRIGIMGLVLFTGVELTRL
jgi:glutamine synthetase adenylyltransferase